MRLAAWHRLFAEALADGQVLLATSNGAARFALIAAGLARGGLKLHTGAYGIIEAGSDGGFRLVEWDRRPGDPARIVAAGAAAAADLDWRMSYSVDEMVASAWSARKASGPTV